MPHYSAAFIHGLTEFSAWKQPIALVGIALASAAIAPPARSVEGLNAYSIPQSIEVSEAAFIPTETAIINTVSAIETVPEVGLTPPQFSSCQTRSSLLAQSIIPADDGTMTIVTQTGNTFNITGGTQTGANLFHSFEQLGLSSQQVANILSSPNIENVLGRVVGGDPSIINGLLQVTGGNSNLFLMNPAGIIFGPNAQISVPGSFTATAASGIQLEDHWFNAMGSNDYANLVATPNGFAFANPESGAVINAGNIRVPQGEAVTLLGGFVVNTGSIEAPGGTINIASVSEENLVRITQEGSLLSLDLPVQADSGLNSESSTLTLSDIPTLLSGETAPHNLGLVVEDGLVRLAAANATIPTTTGTTIVSGTLDTADATANGAGGRIDVLGEQVGLVGGANLDASGASGGGVARVGGDYQGQGIVPNAANTYVSQDSSINANAIDEGNGGRVIVWADDATQFYGNISARGGNASGDGGFVEVSGKENLTFAGTTDLTAPNGNSGTLLLDPNTLTIIDAPDGDGSLDDELTPDADGELFADVADDGANTISVGQLVAFGEDANIILEANNGITIEDIADDSLDLQLNTGSIAFRANADNDEIGDFTTEDFDDTIRTDGGTIEISAVKIDIGAVISNGGSIRLEARNEVDTFDLRAGQDIILIGNSIETNGSDLGANRDIILTSGNIFADDLRAVGNITIRGSADGVPSDTIDTADLIAGQDIHLIGNNIATESSTAGRDFLIEGDDVNLTGNEDARLRAGNNFTIDAETALTVSGSTSPIGLIAGNELNLASKGDLTLQSESDPVQLQSTGNIRLAAEGSLEIFDDNNFDGFFWVQSGEEINVLAESIDINTLNNLNSWFRSHGDINLISNSGNAITAEARFATGGAFSINGESFNRESGTLPNGFTEIQLDEIISSTGDVSFDNYEGEALKIETTGSIVANGDITITAPNTSLLEDEEGEQILTPVLTFDPDIALLSSGPTLILQAGQKKLRNTSNATPGSEVSLNDTTFIVAEGSTSPGNISVIGGDINTEDDGDTAGPVLLSASGDIQTGSITTGQAPDFLGNSVTLSATSGNITIDFIKAGEGFDPPDFGGDIEIAASGFFRAIGFFEDLDVDRDLPELNGGDLSFDDIKGELVLSSNDNEEPILTSISATGDSASGIVRITHGAETLAVGPQFERDENGNIIIATAEEIDELELPEGTRVFLEEVDETGRTFFRLIDSDDELEDLGFDRVTVSSDSLNNDPFSSTDNVSFTAGAITASQNNNNNVNSIRDVSKVSDATSTAGPIQVITTFDPRPMDPTNPINPTNPIDPIDPADPSSTTVELEKLALDSSDICDTSEAAAGSIAGGSAEVGYSSPAGESREPCVVGEAGEEILQIQTPEQTPDREQTLELQPISLSPVLPSQAMVSP